MSRVAVVLRTFTLILAVLSTFGFAEPHPRALELVQLNEFLFQSRADVEVPTAISMNMTIRDLSAGTGTTLISTAIDWSREAARVQTCIDAELVVDAVYEGGTMTFWDAYSGEVTTEPVPEGQMRQLMDQALTDPMSLMTDLDLAEVRYDGPVDYGVVRGEQIIVPYDQMAPFAGLPNAGEMRLIFSAEGVWLGMMMQTAAGTMLAVQDGIIVTEFGPSLRGMTMFQPDENGDMQPLMELRMWNVRAYESLGDEWFSLDHSEVGESNTDRRDELRRHLDEVGQQIAEGDPSDPGYDQLTEELEAIHDEFMASLEPTPVPCPEPF